MKIANVNWINKKKRIYETMQIFVKCKYTFEGDTVGKEDTFV